MCLSQILVWFAFAILIVGFSYLIFTSVNHSQGSHKILYSEKKYESDNVIIEYPVFENKNYEQDIDRINSLIEDEIIMHISNFDSNQEGEPSIRLYYECTSNSVDAISVFFFGTIFMNGTPHPVYHFFSFNYSIKEGKYICLKDFYPNSQDLADRLLCNNNIKDMSSAQNKTLALNEIKDRYTNSELKSIIECINEETGWDFYIRDNSIVGIVFSVPFYAGGIARFEFE